MKNQKTDLRSRYTQETIRKSLLVLMSTKAIKSITVAELCREASITRSTFYNHYFDVYDVYEGVENSFFSEIKTKIDAVDAYAFEYSFFEEIMLLIKTNKDFAGVLIANFGENRLIMNLIEYIKSKYVSDFIGHNPQLKASQVENFFAYMINGSIALLLEWVRGGMPQSAEAMAQIIDHFNQILVRELRL